MADLLGDETRRLAERLLELADDDVTWENPPMSARDDVRAAAAAVAREADALARAERLEATECPVCVARAADHAKFLAGFSGSGSSLTSTPGLTAYNEDSALAAPVTPETCPEMNDTYDVLTGDVSAYRCAKEVGHAGLHAAPGRPPWAVEAPSVGAPSERTET